MTINDRPIVAINTNTTLTNEATEYTFLIISQHKTFPRTSVGKTLGIFTEFVKVLKFS